MKATLRLQGVEVCGILDTGASINILPNYVFKSCNLNNIPIKACASRVATFSGEELHVLGKITIPCSSIDGREKQDIDFVVTDEGKSVLFGLDAIRKLKCLQDELCSIQYSSSYEIDELVDKLQPPEEPVFGNIKGFEHKIRINEEFPPVRQSLRQIPFAVRDKVTAEVNRLVQHGIIEKISASEWGFKLSGRAKT